MPIYEFYCPNNHTIYSFLGKSSRYATVIPKCPADPSFRMIRMISDFAAPRKRQETPKVPGSPAGIDDSRMEAAMAQMEREFGSMDTENPDPRALGRMMRRMAEISGEKIDGRMEEVFRRLEEGVDPESLESEYGDLLGDENSPDDASPAQGQDKETAPPEAKSGSHSRPRLRIRPPKRDPNLYEFEPLPD